YLFHEPGGIIRGANRASLDSYRLPIQILRRCWRFDELWVKSAGCLSANWCLHRPRVERRKTRRPADRAADEVRTGHQSKDRKRPRYCHSTNLARPRRRGNRVKRRDFITLIGGAAAAWPLAARAQQQAMPVVGILSSRSLSSSADLLRAFRQGLKETGYIEDQNVAIESRWAEGHFERLPELATELLQRRAAVIVTTGGSS